ncbi:hypothetical protein SLA2020_484890 [Shorea laevis]
MASRRPTRSALAAIRASRISYHHACATPSNSVVSSLFRSPILDRIAESNAIPHSNALSRGFHSSAPRFSAASSASQVDNAHYSEMAWEGINVVVEAAMMNRQQIVESEHLMKALLGQKGWVGPINIHKGRA